MIIWDKYVEMGQLRVYTLTDKISPGHAKCIAFVVVKLQGYGGRVEK